VTTGWRAAAGRDRHPVLVVIGGLPAVGKTTIAAALARQVGAAFLRIDSIEQAILRATSLVQPVGPVGYVVGYALAGDQLRNGVSVVAECVNPLAVTRDAWREAGLSQGASVVEVEVICSDPVEHRRRAESRSIDVAGLRLPTWQEIVEREYHVWDRAHLVLDTATRSAQDCVAAIRRAAGV
jgi:predicted kinase